MKKHHIHWQAITCTNVAGKKYKAPLARIVDYGYRGTLLTRILNMPKQEPISFEDALRMAGQNFHKSANDSKIGHARGESHWYFDHFVEWISELGYHIELTGDEFEVFNPSPLVA